jgi:hypothetical protein
MRYNKLKLQRRRMEQSGGTEHTLGLTNKGPVKGPECRPVLASAATPNTRREKPIVVEPHLGTARLEVRASPPSTKQISKLL